MLRVQQPLPHVDLLYRLGQSLLHQPRVQLLVHFGEQLVDFPASDLAWTVPKHLAEARIEVADLAKPLHVSVGEQAGRAGSVQLLDVLHVLEAGGRPRGRVVALLHVVHVLGADQHLRAAVTVVEDLDQELRVHLQGFRLVGVQFLRLVPVALH